MLVAIDGNTIHLLWLGDDDMPDAVFDLSQATVGVYNQDGEGLWSTSLLTTSLFVV